MYKQQMATSHHCPLQYAVHVHYTDGVRVQAKDSLVQFVLIRFSSIYFGKKMSVL